MIIEKICGVWCAKLTLPYDGYILIPGDTREEAIQNAYFFLMDHVGDVVRFDNEAEEQLWFEKEYAKSQAEQF